LYQTAIKGKEMMKRSEMLYTGKSIIKSLALSAMLVSSLSADFELTLIDSDGVENKQCVKSYSFSSNLDSVMKEYVVHKDVYTDQETLTNKLYFGKPVYRKIFTFADFTVPASSSVTSKTTPVISNDLESFVSLSFKGFMGNSLISENNSQYVVYNSGSSSITRATYNKSLNQAIVNFQQNTSTNITDLTVTVEYTKQNDELQNESNEINSFIHYTPSSSTTNDVITIKLNDVAVKLKKGFIFNSTDNSCIEK
jgi:hypothetical protein